MTTRALRALLRIKPPRAVLVGSSGQAALLFTVLIVLIGFSGALTVDTGLMLRDRRDAQGDADAIAMAGAIELPNFDVDQAVAAADAIQAARDWAEANGGDPDSEL